MMSRIKRKRESGAVSNALQEMSGIKVHFEYFLTLGIILTKLDEISIPVRYSFKK